MKSALKKVFSLMLVAMLLVTAIPFQASASDISDGSVVDGSIADGSVVDGSIEDGSVVDGAAPKSSSVPAGDIEDGTVVDGSTSGDGSYVSDPAQTPAVNSAIPSSTPKDVTVMYTGDIKNETVILSVTADTDVKSLIERKLGSNYGSQYYVTVTKNGTAVTDIDNELVGDDTNSIVINALIWKVEVTISNGVTDHEESFKIERKITDLITLNDDLLTEARLTKPADKIIASWNVDEDGSGNFQAKPYGTKLTPAANMVIKAVLTDGPAAPGGSNPDNRCIVTFRKTNGDVAKAYYVNAGGKMAEANVVNASKLATPSGYTFDHWEANGRTYSNRDVANTTINSDVTFSAVAYKNGSGTVGGGTIGGGTTGDIAFNEKTAKDIFLYIHNWDNDKSTTYIKRVDLKNYTCVKTYNEVDMSDVYSIVNSAFTNKNGGKIPISDMDGIYFNNRTTEIDRRQDINKYDYVEGVQEMRMGDNDVILHVWIRNYKTKGSSNNSNSTNPKTGDSIVMTVSALGVTASALAAAYYVSKKRMSK